MNKYREYLEIQIPEESNRELFLTGLASIAGIGTAGFLAFKRGYLRDLISRGIRTLSGVKNSRLIGSLEGLKNFSRSWHEREMHRRPWFGEKGKINELPEILQEIRDYVTAGVRRRQRMATEGADYLTQIDRMVDEASAAAMQFAARYAPEGKKYDPSLYRQKRYEFMRMVRRSLMVDEKRQEAMLRTMGVRKATVQDLLGKGYIRREGVLRHLIDENEAWLKVVVDDRIFVDEMGNIYDLRDADQLFKGFLRSLEDDFQLPIVGFNPLRMFYPSRLIGGTREQPIIHLLSRHMPQPILTYTTQPLQEDLVYIGGSIYRVHRDRPLEFVASGFYLVSTHDPLVADRLRKMAGIKLGEWEPKNRLGRLYQALHLGMQDTEGDDFDITEPLSWLGGLMKQFLGKNKPLNPLRRTRDIPLEYAWSNRPEWVVMRRYRSYHESESLADYLAQFTAGRQNMEDVTTATLWPYIFFERLNAGLNSVYLGLPTDDLGSAADIFWNLMKYRVAPIIGGIYAWRYLNYESEKLLGEDESPEDWLADAYVGMTIDFAEIRDSLGITDWAKHKAHLFPGAHFITELPFVGQFLRWDQSAEELREFWEKGEVPIRRGRYWATGNTPWIGGPIDRFEPNWYRKLKSDWQYTETLYGSEDEYWANAPIPTPRYPFATIRHFFTDPYHWEKKHYYDRPYPLTGGIPELEEFPLIGPILNATIGQLLKPQRRMHPEYWSGPAEPVEGETAGHGSQGTVVPGSAGIVVPAGHGSAGAVMPVGTGPVLTVPEGMPAAQSTGEMAEEIEESKRLAAYVTSSGRVEIVSYDGTEISLEEAQKQLAEASARRLGMFAVRIRENLPPTPVATNVQTTPLQWAPGEFYYNITEMAGFYGFTLNTLTGDDGTGPTAPRLADAGQIYSYNRAWWDLDYGGFGGNLSEIARRFLPREDHRNDINPIPNTMPDWLPGPEYFIDFQHGDPYCVSPDTLIEVNGGELIEAREVKEGDVIRTHKGALRPVEAVKIRPVEGGEKVYRFTIATLPAFPFTVSEEHPLLVVSNPQERKQYGLLKRVSIYEQANMVLPLLVQGGLTKGELASKVGLSPSRLSAVLKRLEADGKIRMRTRKAPIEVIDPKPYDIDMIRRGLQWKQARLVKVGDYVAYPRPANIEIPVRLDVTKFFSKGQVIGNDIIYSHGSQMFNDIKEYLTRNGIPQFQWGERKAFLEQMGWDAKTYESTQAAVRKQDESDRFPRYLDIDKDFMTIAGYWVAEGSADADQVSWTFHEDEVDYRRELDDALVRLIGRSGTSYLRKDCKAVEYVIGCQPLAAILSSLFGTGARDKKIPTWFLLLPNDTLIKFLRTLINGDGAAFRSGNRRRITLKTTSRNVAYMVRLILLKLGYVASIVENPPQESELTDGTKIVSGISYHVHVNGLQARKLAKLFGYDLGDDDTIEKGQWYLDNAYVYLRVTKKEELNPGDVPEVIGFQVGVDDSFCVAGVATHNTKIKHGEIRLPGEAYEAIYEVPEVEQLMSIPEIRAMVEARIISRGDLYGPLTRYRILADVAPWSEQFRQLDAKITQFNLSDEEMEEVREIRAQVRARKNRLGIVPYRFRYADVVEEQVTIDRVIEDPRSGYLIMTREYPDNPIKMAGLWVPMAKDDPVAEQARAYLREVLQPGRKITVLVNADPLYRVSRDTYRTIRAVIKVDGRNLNRYLIEQGLAEENEDDFSAPAIHARFTPMEIAIGTFWERFAHMDTPFHTKYLQVRSALEMYRRRDVYGKGFQEWSEPIRDYLIPTYESFITHHPILATLIGAAFGSLFGRTAFGKIVGGTIGASIVGLGALRRATYEAVTGEEWIPERRRREREVEEYFDILKYVKYTRLFSEEAQRALAEEGFDVIQYLRENRLEGEERKERKRQLEQAKRRLKIEGDRVVAEVAQELNIEGASDAESLIQAINQEIKALANTRKLEELPPHAAQALIYYREAQRTMYAYDPGDSIADLIPALPRRERDYFQHFMKAPAQERQEILRIVPSYMRRPLQSLWGLPVDPKPSLEEYFQKYNLPGPDWPGWRPDVSLEAVKIKFIRREGLDRSEFNVYPADLERAEIDRTPVPRMRKRSSPEEVRARLEQVLHGMGIEDLEIDIQPGGSEITVEAEILRDRREEVEQYLEENAYSIFS